MNCSEAVRNQLSRKQNALALADVISACAQRCQQCNARPHHRSVGLPRASKPRYHVARQEEKRLAMTYDLQRFKDAQERDYQHALAEIRAGRKQSHWIWYVFPQLEGLGYSSMCARYGIRGIGEAESYLADGTLRDRLVKISQALLELDEDDPVVVMGPIDALKLRSCMTLFSQASNSDPVFAAVLEKYYASAPDPLTLELLGRA